MWKKSIFKIVATTILLFIVISILNTTCNPYTTYQKDNLYSRDPNQNFLKISYLLEHKNKYDSFIFGSSRVGKINPLLLKNGRFYNMTYSEGLPYEHLQNIKLLLSKGIKIKNIYIGLDDFSYEVDPNIHYSEPMRKLHYLASGESILSFWSFYHNVSINYLFKKRTEYYDINTTGMPVIPKHIDENIEKNVFAHIQEKKFFEPTHYSGHRIEKTIKELQEIHDICIKHQIHLIFFFNPIHITTYMDTDFLNLTLFQKKLSNIQPFYDFSGINNVTTNNYYYYETSHYRLKVGNMIAIRLNGDNNTSFGILVNKQNINSHIEQLNFNRYQWYILHNKQKITNAYNYSQGR